MKKVPLFLLVIFAFWSSPSEFCLPSRAQAQAQPSTHDQDGAAAVVQLLAIGPGRGEMNRECAATGFFVNGEGYILTNAHVVEDAQRCLAGSPQAKIMAKLAEPGAHAATAVSCDVVGIDNVHDLALLKTERPSPAASPYPYAWLDPRPVRPGARIVVIGYPTFRWEPRQEEAKVVRVSAMNLWGEEDIASESGRRAQVVVFDAPLEMGSSGSPVCLEADVVVGVVARRDVRNRAHSVAVSISHAIDLLNRHGVRWHGAAD